MNRFKNLLRKYKVAINVILLFMGISVIVIGTFFKPTTEYIQMQPEESEEVQPEKDNSGIAYDVMLGIGCSITATATITLFLLVVLPDEIESEEAEKLKKWGIRCIHSERVGTAILENNLPKEYLDFIAFGLVHFRQSHTGQNAKLVSCLRKGLNIRIITLHPQSRYVVEQQRLEKRDGLEKELVELYAWRLEMLNHAGKDCKGSIEIKYYDDLPLDFYCRADQRVLCGPYIPGNPSGSHITYEFKSDGAGYKYYTSLFENLWNERGNILDFVDYDTFYVVGDQKESIEQTLKHYCKELSGPNQGREPIGIVVIFKNNLRRTFFSCNKNYEQHKCHTKDMGVVGDLIKLNDRLDECSKILFEDLVNKISFTYTCNETGSSWMRINFTKQGDGDKMDAKAILAIPIISGGRLIGAITFDFSDLPSKYKKELSKMKSMAQDKAVTGRENLEVFRWLNLAESCRRIIQPMLGSEINLQYNALYKEEWK
ncbi:hypothetical protein [Flintibacter porci]|uniref:hypothetical protein n=1 Tax=Flintibacter porci TaxID=3342383 RepID=UPI003F8B033D